MPRISPFLALLAAFAVVLPTVHAQGIQLTGDVSYSDFSGPSMDSERIELLQAPGVLQAITMGERGDNPCFIEAVFARPTGPNQSQRITRRLDLCGSRGPTRSSLETIGSYSALDGPYEAVSRLNVCRNSGYNKVKGVRLGTRTFRFTSSGSYDIVGSASLEFVRQNCRNLNMNQRWQDSATCDGLTGIPVGLRLAIKNGNNIAAIGLLCREVRQSSAPPPTSTPPPTTGTIQIGGSPVVATPAPASNAPRYTTAGSTSTGALAGEAGSDLTVLSGRPNEILYALEFGERSDEPCYVRAFWMNASAGRDNVQTRTTVFDRCNGSAGSLRRIGMANSAVQSTSGRLKGIFALRTRTNGRSGNRVKVKAAYVDLGQVGTTGHDWEESDGFARTNARSNTTEESACGPRRWVTALELHHNTVGSRQAITGIAVRCRRVDTD